MTRKGGYGSYYKSCDSPNLHTHLKNNCDIVVRDDSGASDIITFSTFEDFCKWLKKRNFGCKIFKNESAYEHEYKLNNEFYNKIKTCINDPNFLEKYTCFAIYTEKKKQYQCMNINNYPAIIYKNAIGDIRQTSVLEVLRTLPDIYKKVYIKCHKFLSELHRCDFYYGDMKCENILLSTNNQILIGDYGSLRSGIDSKHVYTFLSPMSNNFVNYWTIGKGSNSSFVENYKSTIFSKPYLEKVYANWRELSLGKKYVAIAEDWFHFGIAMIQFIVKLDIDTYKAFVPKIFKAYCENPKINDICTRIL